jgi:hypothetical protein
MGWGESVWRWGGVGRRCGMWNIQRVDEVEMGGGRKSGL